MSKHRRGQDFAAAQRHDRSDWLRIALAVIAAGDPAPTGILRTWPVDRRVRSPGTIGRAFSLIDDTVAGASEHQPRRKIIWKAADAFAANVLPIVTYPVRSDALLRMIWCDRD